MIDLLLQRLGFCSWCRDRPTPVADWLAEHLPYRLYAGLQIGSWDYNHWVGTVGLTRHARHND